MWKTLNELYNNNNNNNNNNNKGLKDLEIRGRVENNQTTVLLSSARILKRFLKTRFYSDSSENPSVYTGVENSQKRIIIIVIFSIFIKGNMEMRLNARELNKQIKVNIRLKPNLMKSFLFVLKDDDRERNWNDLKSKRTLWASSHIMKPVEFDFGARQRIHFLFWKYQEVVWEWTINLKDCIQPSAICWEHLNWVRVQKLKVKRKLRDVAFSGATWVSQEVESCERGRLNRKVCRLITNTKYKLGCWYPSMGVDDFCTIMHVYVVTSVQPTLRKSLLEMESVNQVQILDEAVGVLICSNTFVKGMNTSILPLQGCA